MILSWIFIVIEPISALMLLSLVLRYRERAQIGAFLRFWMALLAAGLIHHAGSHVELVQDYHPPRTWSWVVIFAAINGAIWTAFLCDRLGVRKFA